MLGFFVGVGFLVGGFYSIYLGFLNSNVFQGTVGGTLILLGMGLITRSRRVKTGPRL